MRADLSPGAQIAQAVHAAHEFALEHPDVSRETGTVVALAVADEHSLLEHADILSGWCSPLIAAVKPFVLFHEPDLGEHTALACVSDGAEFAHLKLAGAAYAA